MASFDSDFGLADRVLIDGCESIVAQVVAVCFRIENPQIEVSWWSNGALQSAWVSPWRLSPAPERPNRDR